jgi:type I site-specific restriction endonuclease
MLNQNPEQIARDYIDKQLVACGWMIQDIKKVNLISVPEKFLRDASPPGYTSSFVAIQDYLYYAFTVMLPHILKK